MGTNITGIGNANAIGFKSRVTGGAYFPPELKDALVGVWSAYGKSNDSTDRNIIKNKIKDKGGDFELLNFNYKEGSGYGKYEEDFTQWIYPSEISINSSRFYNNLPVTSGNIWGAHIDYKLTSSFKIKVSNLKSGGITFFYYKNAEDVDLSEALFTSNGEHIVPANNKSDIGVGFIYWEGTNEKVIVEQIPEFKGAVVTDGVDDLIVSQKSIPEMLKGNTGFTVISMIAQLNSRATYTNYVRNNSSSAGRNVNYGGERIGKTGIYGFTKQNIYEGGAVVINNILGDKSDYTAQGGTANSSSPLKYYVQAWQAANGSIGEARQIAWYWTFIANRVLTEDEINLVIEKYNLDRPGEIVKPQIYYNVKKQKITNENHSAFDDKLIDYSGNGYDAKLYNFNWDKQSGVGSYPISFKDYTYVSSRATVQVNRDNFIITSNNNTGSFLEVNTKNKTLPIYKVKVEGTNTITNGVLSYRFNNTEGVISRMSIPEDGEYEIPESPSTVNSVYSGWCINGGTNDNIEVKVTVIPEYKDSLIFDGVDDYGKVTGLPILKDYTVVADYKRLSLNGDGVMSAPILSKSKSIGAGAFLFNYRDTGDKQNTYSFGTNTGIANTDDLKGEIYYQSKYINNGATINVGAGEDFDSMWIGTFRDNVSNYFNGVLYFAMLFPYSMSEFLIERQIEKIKGGTLYPNQVEFRPIIPEDENITKVNCFVVDSGVWKVIKPGDYVDVGARIVLNVYTKLPYKIAGVSSTAFTGMTIGPSTALNVWDVKGYIKDKTPQKIKLTLAVNEDIVQWNPTISANIPDSYDAVTEWFINGWETKIAVGDWIKKTDRIFFKLKLKEPLQEIGKVTFGGSECQATKASNWSESNNLWEIVTYSSVGDLSQVFNVQVDEYIRYEDIVQPYPILLRFNNENSSEVSWGGKFRVGSTITRIGSIAGPESNLLNGLYSISGLSLNGKAVTSSTSIVEKQMVFKTTATWLLDDNGPKCILSPSRLRIPNSSYKILGHIPDISGHGNHGKINNSIYAEGSGVNNDGSYQLDGVDDFITIPTVTGGGKQVFMKINYNDNRLNRMIYDQRSPSYGTGLYNDFAIYASEDNVNNNIAYQARLIGNTYIDGILNTNITCKDLLGVSQNITITCDIVASNNGVVPCIGNGGVNKDLYVKMAIYDFMLFDNISTDDKIKELNEYVGIEPKVEKPPYYWDTYGKTNFDEDKATIQQRGVAVGNYDLTNYNHAYDKMSGYGGYEFAKFDNTTEWTNRNRENGIEVIERNAYSFTAKRIGTGEYFWEFNNAKTKTLNKELTVNAVSNKNTYVRWEFKYRTAEKPDIDTTILLVRQAMTPNVPITVTLPYKTEEEQIELGVVEGSTYYLLYFDPSGIPVGEEYTVEMLPLYPNGLVLDGVDDYLRNENIPSLTDYTYIFKRELLNNPNASASMYSGSFQALGGGAFIADFSAKGGGATDGLYGFSFGNSTKVPSLGSDEIIYGTKTSVNGTNITPGSNTGAGKGITLGKWDTYYKQMVFYKLMLYPRTTNMLTINMLKNMMAEDNLIDIHGKLFTDKFTGDFNLDFNKDFLIGN